MASRMVTVVGRGVLLPDGCRVFIYRVGGDDCTLLNNIKCILKDRNFMCISP